jgi:acyl carrier protein
MSMEENEFLAELAAILETSRDELSDDFELTEANWDSLTILSTIALIDSAYEITVPADDLTAARTIGELRALIETAVASG